MVTAGSALPKVVSREEWVEAREALLPKEKEATRALDALNAERRRLPMTPIEKEYVRRARRQGELARPVRGSPAAYRLPFHVRPQLGGRVRRVLHGRRQYGAPGSSARPRRLTGAGIARAAVEDRAVQEAHGLERAGYSSFESDFNTDFGRTTDEGEIFGLSVFLRDDDRVFQTYFTDWRGVEHLGSNWTYLDLTPYGRQEEWEDSPDGWPQTPPYTWWRHHDRYDVQRK